MQPDDVYWRRPAQPPELSWPGAGPTTSEQPAAGPVPGNAVPIYSGPPPTTPPPPSWQPPFVVEPSPPRQLPPQDHDRLDLEETRARGVTMGVGMITAAILAVVVLVLCSRALF